jgi:glutamyl-tRNA synthetase
MLARAVQPQCKTFRDAADRCGFALQRPAGYDDGAVKKWMTKNEREGAALLRDFAELLRTHADWSPASLHELVGMGKIAQPIRIAITGTAVSPAIGETLAVLGKDEALARIDACLHAMA